MQEPERTSSTRYPALDGIRGLAILLVLGSHVSNVHNMFFAGDGEFGVWLFFVLSSFLLSLYFFQKPERMLRSIEWANYAFRRFMRIYPLYIGALLAGAAAGWWRLVDLGPSLTLQAPTNWAIYVEFRFYFLLPLVVAAFHFLGRCSLLLPPLALGAAVVAHYWFFPPGSTVPGYMPSGVEILFPEYLIVFVFGSFTAWAYVHTPRLQLHLRKSGFADWIILAMLGALLLASPKTVQTIFPGVELDYYHLEWVPWGAFFALLIYLVMAADGVARRFFESRQMRFFGFISYSLYLFMDFPINALAKYGDWHDAPIATVLSLATPIALAWCSFTLIERPLSRLSLISRGARRADCRASPASIDT